MLIISISKVIYSINSNVIAEVTKRKISSDTMNRSVITVQKPFGYVSSKDVTQGKNIMVDDRAQGTGLIGFYVSLMVAAILVLNVVWPTIDAAINSGGTAYDNFSSTAKTIINLFGLMLVLGLLILIMKPVM